MSKKPNPRMLLTFEKKSHSVKFYKNLPSHIQKRSKLFPHLSFIAIRKGDYNQLQLQRTDRFPLHATHKNTIYKVHGTPNSQVIPWGVDRVGAPSVWSITTGRNVKVGVIDTGIDGSHPDLRANIKGGTNTLDRTSPFRDSNGHGTHVSGTIAALNNTIGVVGVAPNASLYSIKTFNRRGEAELTDIIQGIEWAIAHKINILNMSFGTTTLDTPLHAAIRRAYRQGILMIASAGNEGGPVDFPARFPEVIAVGATDRQNRVALFSNFGPRLDFVEPGVDILSTWPFPPNYMRLSGTSMATPHLVGLCALLLSVRPSLTPRQVKDILNQSATRLRNVSSLRQGAGIVTAQGLRRFIVSSRKRRVTR